MEQYFIYVGRLDELKGIKLLFTAWKMWGYEATRLIVCGTGPLEEWCKDFIDENHCNIEMRGFVTNSEAKQLIANAVALVLPTQWYEGFPMTILESFSSGTPVIGSDIGNVGSLIKDDVTGIRFQHDSAKSLLKAVKEMMCENNFRREKIVNVFEKKYSADANYKQLHRIYHNAIEKLSTK